MSYMDTYKKWCTDSYFDEETRKELLALQGNDAEIEQTWKTMQGRPEFADIEELTNNQNERFLFSTQYLTRRYAKAISDVDEFCD